MHHRTTLFSTLIHLAILILLTLPHFGQTGFSQELTRETVVEGLLNPCGVAIQPGTGHIFVADSGRQKIIRLVDGKPQDVITDFPKGTFGPENQMEIGPLGLVFIDKDHLVVGGGGNENGKELLRVYKVPAVGSASATATKAEVKKTEDSKTKEPAKTDDSKPEESTEADAAADANGDKASEAETQEPANEKPATPSDNTLKADKMEASMMLPTDGEKVGLGDFFGILKTDVGIFVTSRGDEDKGWIARADLKGNKLENFRRFIPAAEQSEVKSPMAITISPEGYLATSQAGDFGDATDSVLAFYSKDGAFLGKYATGLYDITALGYGPKRKRLFCLDYAWSDTSKGGLFKLVAADTPDGCSAVKILELNRPTSMAFDKKGNLYVTICGESKEGQEPNGKLILIKGLDELVKAE